MTLAALRWPALFDALVLDRAALDAGQVWRLWSCHLLHVGREHALVNLVAAALLLLIARRLGELTSMLWVSLALMPAIALGLIALLPELQWYAGLSGLLHGWCVWLLLAAPPRWRRAGLALLAVKLGWEMQGARSIDTVAVVTEAHRLGVATAVLAALAWRAGCRIVDERIRRRRRRLP